jgi:hypothetical protein
MQATVKIFGIGLNKTGTSSLGQALRRLGFRHARHDPALARALLFDDLAAIDAVAEAADSFADWPWPLVWTRMWDRYGPRARYILTTRVSAEAWVASLSAHAARAAGGRQLRRLAYGHADPRGHEAAHAAAYERHNRAIRAFFAAPERRACFAELSWDRGDGWPELCRFLGRPVPRGPFPHANAAAAARTRPHPGKKEAEQQLGPSPTGRYGMQGCNSVAHLPTTSDR